ncbi:MAG TPA: GntR family transcriptional regulator, partial [Polyangiaceae bacterium]
MALRIAAVGFVTVSLRRSITDRTISRKSPGLACGAFGSMVNWFNQLAMTPPKPNSPAAGALSASDTLSQIGPIARSGVMDAVADRLRDEILSGRIAPGSFLPSERELSLALGVNRLTLRAALAKLETLGLVVTRHGARTVVADWRERAGLDALATLIGSKIEPENPAWRELLVSMLEVRRVLAAEAVALAAERHTEADLEAMEAAAEAQRKATGDLLAFARGDVAFQRAVV